MGETDEVSKKEHRTVLYIPSECLQFSPEEASKDKQLLERMEGEWRVLHKSNHHVFPMLGAKSTNGHMDTNVGIQSKKWLEKDILE